MIARSGSTAEESTRLLDRGIDEVDGSGSMAGSGLTAEQLTRSESK